VNQFPFAKTTKQEKIKKDKTIQRKGGIFIETNASSSKRNRWSLLGLLQMVEGEEGTDECGGVL